MSDKTERTTASKTFIALARDYRLRNKDKMPFIWLMCKPVLRMDIQDKLSKYLELKSICNSTQNPMKPERTKEEILNDSAKKLFHFQYKKLVEKLASNNHNFTETEIDLFIREAMEEYRQSSPVESKLKEDFLEGDKLLGLAAHFVTPEPDGSANKTHFTDLVAVLMYYNDYLQGKIEEPKEK